MTTSATIETRLPELTALELESIVPVSKAAQIQGVSPDAPRPHQNSPAPATRSASLRTIMCSGVSPASRPISLQTNEAVGGT